MPDREKVVKGLETCIPMKYETNEEKECRHKQCPYGRENYKPMNGCFWDLMSDALALLEEQKEEIENLKQTAQSMMEGVCLLKEQEAVKPKINEYGEAFCECGENVGIIPDSKGLPSVRMRFCPECGKRIAWVECCYIHENETEGR